MKTESHTLKYHRIVVGPLGTNAYILFSPSTGGCLVLDPGDDIYRLVRFIKGKKLDPEAIILTHGHFDHCGGIRELTSFYQVPVMMHKHDRKILEPDVPVDVYLEDSEIIRKGGMELKVLHTPGHTPGSICLLVEDLLFSGDTLFQGSVGRTDIPGGDYNLLQETLEFLKQLPPEITILPGHGDLSTLKMELRLNPFL